MTRPVLLALLLAAVPAAADPVDNWNTLVDGLLLEAANGDIPRAMDHYERLTRELAGGDPLRVEALYRLGAARLVLGDVEGARDALREGVRTGCERRKCLELLGRIEVEQGSIHQVPTRWSFDSGEHGFVHPWRFAESGSIRLREDTPDGDPALAWSTVVSVRGEDQVVVGFDLDPPGPRGLRVSLRSELLDAHVRLVLHDVWGRKYVAVAEAPSLVLPAGEWVQVEVRLDRAVPLDATREPLEPVELDRLVLQDVTAYYGGSTGPNEILIDDFEVW